MGQVCLHSVSCHTRNQGMSDRVLLPSGGQPCGSSSHTHTLLQPNTALAHPPLDPAITGIDEKNHPIPFIYCTHGKGRKLTSPEWKRRKPLASANNNAPLASTPTASPTMQSPIADVSCTR